MKWLVAEGLPYRYHDLRADGLPASALAEWIAALGWERLLNRRGTTWRKLAEADRADIDRARATTLMQANPTLVKRPVFAFRNGFAVGFTDAERATLRAAADR